MSKKKDSAMADETRIVTAGRKEAKRLGLVNPPVFHASTVLRPSLAAQKEAMAARKRGERLFFYGRDGSPTARALEDAMAALEGAHDCLTFSSGLGAISTALLACLSAGDHMLVTDGVYRPVRVFCDGMLARLGVETTYYPPRIGAGIAELIRPNTRVVYVESPSSQTFEMQDLPAIAEVAHAHDALVLVDNTWATPYFHKPLALGADMSIQAATKYIVGHSDAMLGTVATTEAAWPLLRQATREIGQCAGPDDLYLGQRGLRSMAVRLRHQQNAAIDLATWFKARPEVARVLHPALPDDPGHAIWKRDFTGASGLFAVELRPCSETALAAMVDGLEYFGIGASWGGYESLVLPANPLRTAVPWRAEGPLLRFHVGLEAPDDLKADLDAGFARLARALA